MSDRMCLLGVLAAAICTLLLRALPFTLLGKRKEMPPKIQYLGRMLPPAIMAVLVIYCLRDITTDLMGNGIRELVAVGVCVGLHVWRKNTLLSIFISTAVYMLLCLWQ